MFSRSMYEVHVELDCFVEISVVKNGQNGRLIGLLVGDGDQTVTNSLVGVVFADQTD